VTRPKETDPQKSPPTFILKGLREQVYNKRGERRQRERGSNSLRLFDSSSIAGTLISPHLLQDKEEEKKMQKKEKGKIADDSGDKNFKRACFKEDLVLSREAIRKKKKRWIEARRSGMNTAGMTRIVL